MENASKALIIAGGVLIALLVISLLVFFFNNLQTVMQAKEASTQIEQATEFNKRYDVYNRDNLSGSEILSIVNQVADYNGRTGNDESIIETDSGYTKISVRVRFKNPVEPIDNNGRINQIINTNKSYTADELIAVIRNGNDGLEDKISEYGDKKITKSGDNINIVSDLNNRIVAKKISSVAGYRDNQLIDMLWNLLETDRKMNIEMKRIKNAKENEDNNYSLNVSDEIKRLIEKNEKIDVKMKEIRNMRLNTYEEELVREIELAILTERERIKSYVLPTLRNEINAYISYKSALTNIKSKTFRATNFHYNAQNGRLDFMNFEEN